MRDGCWRAAVPRDVMLGFEGIVLGGRKAIVRGRAAVPESGRVRVRAVWRERSVLHVRSGTTGEDLADVELLTPRFEGNEPLGLAAAGGSVRAG